MRTSIFLQLFLLISFGSLGQQNDTIRIANYSNFFLVKSSTGDHIIKYPWDSKNDSTKTIVDIGIEEEGLKISVTEKWDNHYKVYFAQGDGWQGHGYLHDSHIAVTKPAFERIVESDEKFNGIYDFDLVWLNGLVGVFEKNSDYPQKSKLIVNTMYDSIVITRGDATFVRFMVKKGKHWGLANRAGKLDLEPYYDSIDYNPLCTAALIKEDGKWGIYDLTDGIVLNTFLDKAIIGDDYSSRSSCIVAAESFGAWGAYNMEGKQLCEFKYDGFVKYIRRGIILSKKGKLYKISDRGDVSRYKGE